MPGFLKERIYLQVLLLYGLGIALGARLAMPVGLPARIFVPTLLLIACLLALHFIWQHSAAQAARLPVILAIVLCGFTYCNLAVQQVTESSLLHHCGREGLQASARVSSLPKYQRGHLRFMAVIEEVEGRETKSSSGRCQFYLRCEPGYLLSPGDRFRFSGELEEVQAPRNRGQFNYRAYLLQRGTLVTCYLPSPAYLDLTDDSGSRRLAWLTLLRSRLTDSLTRHVPEQLQGLAVSVVYGDKITDLDEELEERFRRAGLTHILVASGTQVSLLILLMAMMLWRSPRSFDARGTLLSIAQFAVTIAVVVTYAGLTGYETSIVRALTMGVLLCAGRLFMRQVDGMSTLAQAGLVLLLAQPLQLFTPGFQLSFLATFGLIYVMGTLSPLLAKRGGWRGYLQDGLLTTAGAQLFVTPVLAASFNQFSLVGLLSNMLAVPLAFVLLVCGALASFGLAAVPLLGPALGWLVSLFAAALDGLAGFFGNLPFSSIAISSPPAWFSAAWFASIFLAGEWIRRRGELSTRQLALLQAALLACVWLASGWLAFRFLLPHPELSLLRLERSFAIYHCSPSGQRSLLVDPYWLERRHNADNLLSSLRARGCSRLDGLYWIGSDPGESALDLLSDKRQTLGDADLDKLPFASNGRDMLACRLGGSRACVVWADDPQGLAGSAGAIQGFEAGILVLSRPGSSAEAMDRLSDRLDGPGKWLSVDSTSYAKAPVPALSDAEICFEPTPGGGLRSFTLRRQR